jgi:hypothetical protein
MIIWIKVLNIHKKLENKCESLNIELQPSADECGLVT